MRPVSATRWPRVSEPTNTAVGEGAGDGASARPGQEPPSTGSRPTRASGQLEDAKSQLLARAVVVIDSNGAVLYNEMVPEIADEPNYDAAIAAPGSPA